LFKGQPAGIVFRLEETVNDRQRGNRRRLRRLPGRRRETPQAVDAHIDIEQACRQLLDDTDASVRLLFAGDPALGPAAAALQLTATTAGQLPGEISGSPMPVLLVEPHRTALTLPEGTKSRGNTYDLRTGIAAKLGLALFTTTTLFCQQRKIGRSGTPGTGLP
jgi:hypothetical protein